MKNTTKIFIVFLVLTAVLAGVFFVKSSKKPQNPLDSMKNIFNQASVPPPAAQDIRPAKPIEIGQPTLMDKLKQIISPKDISEETAPMQLFGQVKDRKILSAFFPICPAWVKEKGLEPEVVLWFHVLPKGAVREDISISRSSGYKELDELAIKALKEWAFYPDEEGQGQWGQVNFRFRRN